MNILGKPIDGDELTTTPLTGAASGMQFMLRRAQDFAAASKTLVSATVSNKGTADITATAGKISTSDNPPIVDKVFTDSNSPLTATNFLGDGSIAAIPAGSPEADILSFKSQSQMSFQLTETEIQTTTSLSLEVNSVQHAFDLTYSSVFPKANSSEKWKSLGEIADALNRGTIKNSNSQTLTELGLFASGSGEYHLCFSRQRFLWSIDNAFRWKYYFGTQKHQHCHPMFKFLPEKVDIWQEHHLQKKILQNLSRLIMDLMWEQPTEQIT